MKNLSSNVSSSHEKNPAEKYLPLKFPNIIGITELTPDAIKKAVKKCKSKDKHTTLLNAVVNALGFSAGFSGFQKEYAEKLIPFMEKNNLLSCTDLFTHQKAGYAHHGISITQETLANRLFMSALCLPERFFSGYDFDFKARIEDGWWHFNRNATSTERDYLEQLMANAFDDQKYIATVNTIYKNLHTKEYRVNEIKRDPLDFLLGGLSIEYNSCGWNLLGDFYFQFKNKGKDEELIIELYDSAKDGTYKTEIDQAKRCTKLLKRSIDSSSAGWLDIIPYNENLIFLRGKNGEYDFVFKKQKNKAFEIKKADESKQEFMFRKWLYFSYQGWCEQDRHFAEIKYYKDGGSPGSYPGQEVILDNYLRSKADLIAKEQSLSKNASEKVLTDFYIKPKKISYPTKILDNFSKVLIDNKTLAVSNLITSEEFINLVPISDKHWKKRQGDLWQLTNCNQNSNLPTAVTLSDVYAYIKAFNKQHKINTRLLAFDEYISLRGHEGKRPKDMPLEEENGQKLENVQKLPCELEWAAPDSHHFHELSSNMLKGINFDDLQCRFKSETQLFKNQNNIQFCLSYNFAEYLKDYIVRPYNMSGFYGDKHYIPTNALKNSTGKYKLLKIGFRLCYEIDNS